MSDFKSFLQYYSMALVYCQSTLIWKFTWHSCCYTDIVKCLFIYFIARSDESFFFL